MINPEALIFSKSSSETTQETPKQPIDTELGRIVADHTLVVIERWPDQIFSFSDQNIVGTGVIPANRLTRVRTVINTIASAEPDAIEKSPQETTDEALKSITGYLISGVIFAGEKIPRQEIIQPTIVLGLLEVMLQNTNDPIHQAIKQLERRYSDKLAPHDLAELRRDVLLVGKKTSIVRIYKEAITMQRKATS